MSSLISNLLHVISRKFVFQRVCSSIQALSFSINDLPDPIFCKLAMYADNVISCSGLNKFACFLYKI